jgi:hypothetical protein
MLYNYEVRLILITRERTALVAIVLKSIYDTLPGGKDRRAYRHTEVKSGDMLVGKQSSIALDNPMLRSFPEWQIIGVCIKVLGDAAS